MACTGKCRCVECKNFSPSGPDRSAGGDKNNKISPRSSKPRSGLSGTPATSGSAVQPGSGDTPHPSPETALGAAVLLAMSPKKPDLATL